MSFKIVSWYTPQYKEVIDTFLIPSLDNLNLDYSIYPIESKKTWKENTNLKPIIASTALIQNICDILLLDADCKVNFYPKLFDDLPEEYDMACFYLNWDEWYNRGSNKIELCSGTLFFRNRVICHELINAWKTEGLKNPNKLPDQEVLANIIKDFPQLNIHPLAYEYCWINTLPGGGKPHVRRPDKVYIEHYQASRENKGKIK